MVYLAIFKPVKNHAATFAQFESLKDRNAKRKDCNTQGVRSEIVSQKEMDLLDQMDYGRKYDVATSRYSYKKTDHFHPIALSSQSTIRSMINKGLIKGDVYWRGATIERIA